MNRFKFAVLALTFSSSIFAGTLGDTQTFASGFDWTGFYAGLNAGAVRHTMNMTDNEATSFLSTIQQVSNPDFSGGFQLGYRRQLLLGPASGVYGLEFSLNFSDAKFNQNFGSPFALYELHAEHKLKHVGLLQFIGGIAADRTLLFLAAGLAQIDVSGRVTSLDGLPFFYSFGVGKDQVTSAFGAGIEYAFNERISARIKGDVITPRAYTTFDENNDSFQISNQIVQGTFGINVKFA